MTISEDAWTALDTRDVDRDDLLLAAKSVAQQIIDASRASDTPLSGLVYDVWGLYNDGMPKCRWTAPYENDEVVFSAQFRVDGADAFVVRRQIVDVEDLVDLVESIRGAPPSL